MMFTLQRQCAAMAIVALFGALASCGEDESGRSGGDGGTRNSADAQMDFGALPEELDCASYNVDLRPLLQSVTDSNFFSTSCSWEGLTPSGNTASDSLAFKLEEGLPADYAALRASLGEEEADGGQMSEVAGADGWTYGFQVPVFGMLNDFYDGSDVLAFYLVDATGKGASCSYLPSMPDEVLADERVDYMTDRVDVVSAVCSQLLSAATS